MRKLTLIVPIILVAISCANNNHNNDNNRAQMLELRSQIQLPDSCLQFDSIGLGMKFRDAKVIVATDSDFCEVREFTQGEDSVIEFKHNFYLYDGDVTGFTGKIIEYQDSVEKIELMSMSSGYDFPIREQGIFLKVAKTYAEKYGYEPAMNQHDINPNTKLYEYSWKKEYNVVTVSFEVETLHTESGKLLYTGKVSIKYLDEVLNRERLEELRLQREKENEEIYKANKEKLNQQNI